MGKILGILFLISVISGDKMSDDYTRFLAEQAIPKQDIDCQRIPENIRPMISYRGCKEFADRAERGIINYLNGNKNVVSCVEAMRKYNGYGGTGDYGSFEYCQRWEEKPRGDDE